eukprot:s494_g16.t1
MADVFVSTKHGKTKARPRDTDADRPELFSHQSQRKKALESILADATPDAPCIFDEKVGKYRSSPDAAAAEMETNKALKDFQKITDSKKEAAKMQMRQRAEAKPAYDKPTRATGKIFPEAHRDRVTSCRTPLRHEVLIDACKRPLHQRDLPDFTGTIRTVRDCGRNLGQTFLRKHCGVVSDGLLPLGGKSSSDHPFDTATVRMLLCLVALGGAACQKDRLLQAQEQDVQRFMPSVFHVARTISPTQDFKTKYSATLQELLEYICTLPESQWSLSETDATEAAVKASKMKFSRAAEQESILDGATDLVRFLGAAARQESRGLKSKLLRPRTNVLGRRSHAAVAEDTGAQEKIPQMTSEELIGVLLPHIRTRAENAGLTGQAATLISLLETMVPKELPQLNALDRVLVRLSLLALVRHLPSPMPESVNQEVDRMRSLISKSANFTEAPVYSL